MRKIAFIYPGQGAQKVGMGKDFYENGKLAKELFDRAEDVLDFDVRHICFDENEEINRTDFTQAAMVTTCLAITEEIKNKGLYPHVTAGLSLGEYAAIATAGGMSFEDAVKTVRKRGIFMQQAVPQGSGMMAAVLGMSPEKIEEIVDKKDGVFIANYNCPGQIVITGEKDAVQGVERDILDAGAKRFVELNVSGPFHSGLMKGAAEQLSEELKKVEFRELKIPYVTNVTAKYISDINEAGKLLVEQVYSSVRWEQSVRAMLDDGVDLFVEIGPGKTLAGFIRKIDRSAEVINISSYDDLLKLHNLNIKK